jgi:hypothetical protein
MTRASPLAQPVENLDGCWLEPRLAMRLGRQDWPTRSDRWREIQRPCLAAAKLTNTLFTASVQ